MVSSIVQSNPVRSALDLGDVNAQFSALLTGCGLYDLSSRAKFAITGGDRTRWLNGMVTNNIRDLSPGHGVYAFLLNPQGHILGDLYAYNRGDSMLIDTDQSQSEKLRATFDHYIIMDDVEVNDISGSLAAIGLAGPNAGNVIRAAGLEVPASQPLEFIALNWRNATVTVVRGDNPGVESYEVWLAPDQADDMNKALVEAGAALVGATAVELLRVSSGTPRYGQDIRERDLPQETEQPRALHFNKGCYIGQEIVERIRSRGNVHRKFTGFTIQGSLPSVGTKIQAQGKEVGEITSVASLPVAGGEHTVALGYVRRELSAPGTQFQVGSSQISISVTPFQEVFQNEILKQ